MVAAIIVVAISLQTLIFVVAVRIVDEFEVQLQAQK